MQQKHDEHSMRCRRVTLGYQNQPAPSQGGFARAMKEALFAGNESGKRVRAYVQAIAGGFTCAAARTTQVCLIKADWLTQKLKGP